MHPDLERLAELAQVDEALDKLARELEGARRTVEVAAQAEAAAVRRREDAAAALAAVHAEQHALNRRLQEYRTRRQGALRALETGAGSPESAQRQLEQCTVILDETETSLLVCMERQDALELALTRAEQDLAEAAAAHAHAEQTAPQRIGELEARQVTLKARRAEILSPLPDDIKRRYGLLRERRGRAVAPIEGDACRECRMTVGSKQVADLQRGIIEPCRRCGRWLIPPPPKEQRAAPGVPEGGGATGP